MKTFLNRPEPRPTIIFYKMKMNPRATVVVEKADIRVLTVPQTLCLPVQVAPAGAHGGLALL